ncbi:MAG: NmrA family NAD(P)-binding protein, partial [Solirubrobacterales bacterium]|nr:NmrA family NAD(P)-binding protein [Solirubrobacterales bacterium]
MMTILVTGATGMFGSRVARGLLDAGQPTRALVRGRCRAKELEAAGVQIVVG